MNDDPLPHLQFVPHYKDDARVFDLIYSLPVNTRLLEAKVNLQMAETAFLHELKVAIGNTVKVTKEEREAAVAAGRKMREALETP